MMGPINEARIIEIVFLFLRERYKYYPLRSGNIQFNRNLKGYGKVTVDGTITFPRNGETHFLASIEATDYGKREELWFRFSWELALWDAVAISSGFLCALFTWMHLSSHLGLFKGNFWLLGLVGLILLASLSYLTFLSIRPLKRYRYIYAIEQFRRYAANEQWVAFAWDVFPSGNTPVFLELREQCVLNGLGMLEILRDGKVKMHLSPAREGIPGIQKRPILQLFLEKKWIENLSSERFGKTLLRGSVAFLNRLTNKTKIYDLLRFERPVTVQACIILASITLTLILMWREYGQRPVIFEQEKRYERKMLAKKQELEASLEDFVFPVMLDTAAVFKFDKNAKPYLRLIPDSLPDWQNGSRGWIILEGGQIKSIPCDKVYSQLQGRYLVSAGMFFDLEYLKATMLRLRSSGILVQAVWGACFFERKNYYILVFQETFDQAEPAQRAAVRINESLYRQGFPFSASFLKID